MNKAVKCVIYSFLLGGLLALVAQAILAVWTAVVAGTALAAWKGAFTLMSMGVIGCILGGLGIYQFLGDKAPFGSYLPFSGFAMACGMKAVGPWMGGKSVIECLKPLLWLVIWFNAAGLIVCAAFGFACTELGFIPQAHVQAPDPTLLFPGAFLMGGILCAFFEICWQVLGKVWKGAKHVHILFFAWCCGALIAPFGFSLDLITMFGEGFAVMIPVGGHNMYMVGMELAEGNIAGAIGHLSTFFGAVGGLAVTACFTWIIYNAKFGRQNIIETRKQRAQGYIEDLNKPAHH